MEAGGFLRGLLVAFLLITMAGFIISGLVAIRNALIASGLLSGSISSTFTKTITLDDVKANLTRQGLTNTSTRIVYVKDVGDSYIITVMERAQVATAAGDRPIETWQISRQFTIPKTKNIVIQSEYDFAPLVKILAALVGVMILIIVAEKLGIKL